MVSCVTYVTEELCMFVKRTLTYLAVSGGESGVVAGRDGEGGHGTGSRARSEWD